MAKTRTTVTLDEEVLKAVKIRAAREGLRESEVIEQVLRESLTISPFADIWAAQEDLPPLTEDEAMELALEAQREVRSQRKSKKKSARKAA